MQHYARVATTVATKIQKGSDTLQTLVHSILFTATTTGTVAVTDGSKTITIDVIAGINNLFEHPIAFAPGADVTITPTGPTVSVFAEYTYK